MIFDAQFTEQEEELNADFGVVKVVNTGTSGVDTSDANAVAGNLLSGKTAYVNGRKITGTMTNRGTMNQTMDGINSTSVPVPEGYYSGGAVEFDSTTLDGHTQTQYDLIQQIKTALDGKAGGGKVLPTLTNPGTTIDLAEGKQLIDENGSVVNGAVPVITSSMAVECFDVMDYEGFVSVAFNMDKTTLVREGARIFSDAPASLYGDANPEDVAQGRTFTSAAGVRVVGTATLGGGMAIKSGTTTNRVIDTGLSDIEQFFIYKESQTATGLIHLHYTKSATSRMYASAWSTQNYGTKTITNGTGGVTVNGGTLTISATQAAQGALSSGVTYKWVAIGKE